MAIITISRQFGAGGRTIGEKVAQALGYRYIHEDIVKEIALRAKCSDEKIRAMERRGTSKLSKFLDKIVSASYIERLISDDYKYVDEGTYIDALKNTMLDLYNQGNAVIVGRGGQFIFKGFKDAYHVLLVADIKYRIKFLVDHYYLKESQAEKAIRRADTIRTRYLTYFADPKLHDDPLSYHLTINTELTGVDKAVKLILALL